MIVGDFGIRLPCFVGCLDVRLCMHKPHTVDVRVEPVNFQHERFCWTVNSAESTSMVICSSKCGGWVTVEIELLSQQCLIYSVIFL